MASETRLTSRVCPGCACLCDDIDLVIEGDRVLRAFNVCRWGGSRFTGRKKFSDRQGRARLTGARLRDRTAAVQAIDPAAAATEAARLLAGARRIVVYGLCQLSSEAFDPLLALSRGRNTLFLPSEGPLWTEYLRLLGDFPAPLTTLDEIRNQADLVLFWGANPAHSCPRLLSRYALFARGRFTERGFEDRAAFTVDIQETEMARVSTLLTVAPEREVELLQALAAALGGGQAPGQAPPISKKGFRALVDAFAGSRYPVIFCGRGPCYSPDRSELFRALAALVVSAGKDRPLFLLPLATDFNTLGFYQAFAQADGWARSEWTLGADPRAWTPSAGDVLLAVSGDALWAFSEDQRRLLSARNLPVIALSGYENRTDAAARIAVATALLGIDGGGHAVRLDGVTLALPAVLTEDRPTDTEILAAIGSALP